MAFHAPPPQVATPAWLPCSSLTLLTGQSSSHKGPDWVKHNNVVIIITMSHATWVQIPPPSSHMTLSRHILCEDGGYLSCTVLPDW